MKTNTARAAIAALMLLSTPVALAQNMSVDASFSTAGGQFSTGGDITFAAKVIEQDGMAAVCGAYTWTGPNGLQTVVNVVISQTQVRIGDETITGNIGHFHEAFTDDLTGSTAHCQISRHEWSAAFATTPAEIKLFRVSGRQGRAASGGRHAGFSPGPSTPGKL